MSSSAERKAAVAALLNFMLDKGSAAHRLRQLATLSRDFLDWPLAKRW